MFPGGARPRGLETPHKNKSRNCLHQLKITLILHIFLKKQKAQSVLQPGLVSGLLASQAWVPGARAPSPGWRERGQAEEGAVEPGARGHQLRALAGLLAVRSAPGGVTVPARRGSSPSVLAVP